MKCFGQWLLDQKGVPEEEQMYVACTLSPQKLLIPCLRYIVLDFIGDQMFIIYICTASEGPSDGTTINGGNTEIIRCLSLTRCCICWRVYRDH